MKNLKQDKRAALIAKRCIAEARAELGPGWFHVSVTVRWGLVAARIVGVMSIQDEETDPARLIAYFHGLVESARSQMGLGRDDPRAPLEATK